MYCHASIVSAVGTEEKDRFVAVDEFVLSAEIYGDVFAVKGFFKDVNQHLVR